MKIIRYENVREEKFKEYRRQLEIIYSILKYFKACIYVAMDNRFYAIVLIHSSILITTLLSSNF